MIRSLPVLALAVFSSVACSPGGDPIAEGTAHFKTNHSLDSSASENCLVVAGGIGRDSVPGFPQSDGSASTGTGDVVVDGESQFDDEEAENPGHPYEITCTVSGEGPIDISVFMRGANTSPNAGFSGSLTTLELNGTINADGQGSGDVFFKTNEAGGMSSVEPCTFFASPAPLHACSGDICITTDDEPTDTGKLFITFDCPHVEEAGKVGSYCESDGTVIVKNCVTQN